MDEVDLVVDVPIQLFVSVSVDVLSIVEIEVDAALEHDNLVLLGKHLY